MTDAIWKVACDCWAHAPSDRPSMNGVITMLRQAQRPDLTPVTVTPDLTPVAVTPDLTPVAVTTSSNLWINTNPVALLTQLVSAILPYGAETPYKDRDFLNEFFLKGLYEAVPGHRPISTGAFGTLEISRPKTSIFSAVRKYLPHAAGESVNALVAIKYLRYSNDLDRNRQLDHGCVKQLTPLKYCDHPNILRVLGLWNDPRTMRLGIVSQFADKGDLARYLRAKPSFPELTKILLDIATGLEYLHTRQTGQNQLGIVHGNLTPYNVLIMTDGAGTRAVLGDFGLCEIVDENGMTSIFSRREGIGGIPEYLGPEVYLEGDLGRTVPQVMQTAKYCGCRTVKGDVFAFGMLSFTTLGGDVRRALCGGETRRNPITIAISIVEGHRPSRQDLVLAEDHKVYDGDVDRYWPSIEACWQGDAAKRPEIEDVRDKIPRVLPEKP